VRKSLTLSCASSALVGWMRRSGSQTTRTMGYPPAVYGRDVTRALAVAKRIESRMCHINGPTLQDEAQMPFGGVKGSGYGHFGGKASVAEFTRTALDHHQQRTGPLSHLKSWNDPKQKARAAVCAPASLALSSWNYSAPPPFAQASPAILLCGPVRG